MRWENGAADRPKIVCWGRWEIVHDGDRDDEDDGDRHEYIVNRNGMLPKRIRGVVGLILPIGSRLV